MQKPFLKLFTTAMVMASLLTSAPVAFAQAITTSSLNGTVQTEQGQPISGATITVTHVPTSSAYQATSRKDGTYVLHGLRPGGPYTVSSSATGYVTKDENEVFLDIDVGADVGFRLKAAEVLQLDKLTVTSDVMDKMFDPTQTGSGTYFSSNDIRNLPAGDRSINSLARLDPRISYNRDPSDRAISANGMSNRFNSIQVDGVSANDPFGLNANNTAAERNVVPMDSLDAISISTSPYKPRNGGFVGAQVNAITKSGGNEFHGSVYYTYRGRTLMGKKMVGQTMDGKPYPIPDFSEQTTGATLNGPIIPKKLFFSLSYEKVDEQRIAPSPVAFIPAATVAQITAAAAALGFETGSTNPPANELSDKNIIAKFDWKINADHRAVFRYNDVKSSRPTFPGFGTGISENNFSYDSYWYQEVKTNETFLGQVISRWSDKLNTEVSVSHSKYHSEPKNNSRQPAVQIRNIPVPGSSNTAFVTFGTEVSRHANILDVETDTAELFSSYELTNNQTLQAGLQYDSADTYNLFVQNAYGNYDFNNLAEFLAISALNNGTLNYRSYTYNQILPGVEPAAVFNEKNIGLFLNDSWHIRPNLTIDAGLRFDMAKLPDAVPYNASFESAFGLRNDYTYDGKSILQPRLGFNWQPNFKGKRTIVRGGAGLFYGRAPRVWVSNSYSNTGANFRTWTAGSSASPSSQAPIVSSDPDIQATTASGLPAQTVAFMNPGFQLPSRYKANLAIEQEVGFWDLKATAEIENTWVKNDVFYRNINLQATGTSVDGRLQYFNAYTAVTQNPTTGAYSGSSGTRLVNTGFANRTMMLTNTGTGGTQAISFSLEKPRTKSGWAARIAYVNTHASETLFGTSSVASSNWNNRSVFNVNAQEEHRSELEVRDRIIATVAKDFEIRPGYRTTISMFYEGRSGYPFSFVYTTDANGDSQTQNDLAYIPVRSGDAGVRFGPTIVSGVTTQTAAEAQAAYFRIVDRFGLKEGHAVDASGSKYPWVNQFDLSFKQEIKLPGWRHKAVLGADILNVGNLIDNTWGVIHGSNQFFAKKEGIAAASYDGATKQYVISNVNTNLANGVDFSPSLGRGEPAATRWTVMFTARYEF